ncbi:MAG TPA: DUF416 family protein [Puia sp.]|jgi:uncharacterized protein YjaG (DUF416 family)|nr:DUF416 family protein [Puia sp.]
MNYPTFIAIFKEQVARLSVDRSLEFAQRISHELVPEYRTFFQIHQWGNPTVLEASLALAERSRGDWVDPTELTEMLAKLEAVTPHMDNFGDFCGSYALNACVAVYYLLQFLMDHKPEYIYNVGIAYTDTVDFKLAEQDEDITDEELAHHPQMLHAWNRMLEETR